MHHISVFLLPLNISRLYIFMQHISGYPGHRYLPPRHPPRQTIPRKQAFCTSCINIFFLLETEHLSKTIFRIHVKSL